jgi:hypothetical protein
MPPNGLSLPVLSGLVIAAGPLWIVASVVVAASGWKRVDPAPTARALRVLAGGRSAGPISRRAATSAWLLGLGEGVVALAVVWRGGSAAWLLAALYSAFALVAWRLRGRNVDCGCFGAASTKSSWIHVVVNVTAAAIAAWAAAIDVPGLRSAADDLPAGGIAHLVLVAAGTAAMVALLTVLPAVRDLSRSPRVPDQPVLFRLRSEAT